MPASKNLHKTGIDQFVGVCSGMTFVTKRY
jgi:hypothetical protein